MARNPFVFFLLWLLAVLGSILVFDLLDIVAKMISEPRTLVAGLAFGVVFALLGLSTILGHREDS